MRIGLVLPAVPAYSETFFTNKIAGLKASGHTVIIFVDRGDNKKYLASEIKVAPKLSGNLFHVALISFYRFSYSFLFHFKVSSRLYRLDKLDGIGFIQRIKNIISNHHIISEPLNWLHFGYGTLALNRENVAAAMGAKMAVSFRGFDISIYPLKNPGCYLRLWSKVDKIHVISNDIKELVYKHGFKGHAKIIKITPAIDTSYFKNEEQQLHADKNNFITIARLHWKKGLVYTLEALALLKKAAIPFHYTIIGDGLEYERLRFATHQLGIDDQVTFTGEINHELVRGKLRDADLYLQYSIQEGFCNAVLEAQAMGLLCIVSDAEGLSENVLHEKTGWVVPKMNGELLSAKIIEVLNLERKEKLKIIKNAKFRVHQEFNIQKQQQEFIQFYS